MKFSLNLLKQFVKINISAQKLGELLTERAFEVEVIAIAGGGFENIFAAKVAKVNKHPNADRLRIVALDIGGKIIEPVVCGAFNFGVNDVVALALPGAKIAKDIHSNDHQGFTLEKAAIRGVQSQGMICAEFELGLSDYPGTEPTIMLLDKSVKPGTPLAKVIKLSASDVIFNIALPANRSDLHSHLGLAREIAAVTNVRLPTTHYPLPTFKPSKSWDIIVKNKDLCPRYLGVRLKVKVGPSPKFIADFIRGLGMRPINNVVDITNYVMMELGNPIHAFDSNTVEGGILVKTARKGEKFLALNHKQYTLDDDTLMICDEKKYLGIAAIMGGKDSEIKDSTSEIILEVANFQGAGIRKTCKKLGLTTEGSRMWEKGIHPKLSELALARSVELLQKYADGKITEFAKFENPIKNQGAIKFKADDINKLLGTDLKSSEIKKYLSRYEISTKLSTNNLALSTPPWWRTDVTSMPDLAEEVLKLYGYNQVKAQPVNIAANYVAEATGLHITDDIYAAKSFFARLGYTEVQNYNFVSEKDIIRFGGNPKDHIEIQNPLSEDQRYLKKYPLIPILKNIALNQKHLGHFKLFEVAKQYFGYQNEPVVLLAGIFHKTVPLEKMIMVVKADVLEFLKTLGIIGNIHFTPDDNVAWLHLKIAGTDAGGIGYVNADLAKKFDIEGNFAFSKLELEKILPVKKDIIFAPINKFPKVERDISIIVNQKIAWAEIEKTVRPASNLIRAINLFEAPFLASDKDSQKFHQNLKNQHQKNLGIRLTLEAFDRTLTDSEVAGIMGKIVLKLRQEVNAEIR